MTYTVLVETLNPAHSLTYCNVVAMVDSKEDVGQDAQDGRLGGVAWPEAGL